MTNYKNVFNCCGEKKQKNNTKPQTHTPLAPKLLGDLEVAGLEHTKLQLFVCRTDSTESSRDGLRLVCLCLGLDLSSNTTSAF